jgi:hypothetical protein
VAVAEKALSGAQLLEVLGLMRGADSVELKLTVPDEQRYGSVDALGIDPLDARVRQVFFFDTSDLALDRSGMVVRARRIQDAAADSVVKLRPVVPDEVPAKVRREPTFGIEVDVMPGGFVCSASFKGASTNEQVRGAARGTLPLRKVFTKGQRAFFEAHAPAGIGLDDLAVLGPVNVLKLKFKPDGFAGKIAAELWFYPDGSRVLELSTKCAPNVAFQVGAEAKAYLSERGLDVSGRQQTKTRTALTYFSKRLAEGGA